MSLFDFIEKEVIDTPKIQEEECEINIPKKEIKEKIIKKSNGLVERDIKVIRAFTTGERGETNFKRLEEIYDNNKHLKDNIYITYISQFFDDNVDFKKCMECKKQVLGG